MKNKIMVKLVLVNLILCTGLMYFTDSRHNEKDNSDMVVVTREQRFDYLTWKVKAANGTWHYEIKHAETGKLSTGFNSAIDKEGNDWIANNCEGNREWRGWPNFGADGFGHPCRGGEGQSRWLDSKGNPLEFDGELTADNLILESWNENFKVRYHFFPSHISIEVLEAKDLYAFLWEGPVAGKMQVDRQYYVLQDGEKREFTKTPKIGFIEPEFGRNFPSPYFYFGEEKAKQVVYIGVKNQSEGGDEGWAQPDNMVVFSFGRENDERALRGTDAVAVFGFLDKEASHKKIDQSIKARLKNPFKNKNKVN